MMTSTAHRALSRVRRTISASLVATVMVAAVPLLLGGGAARANTATPDWKPCAGSATPGAAQTFQCATVQVPLDYDATRGHQIGIRLIRKPARNRAHRLGTLFWNPGGPGGAATTSAAFFVPRFPAAVRARYDIVSFDPRGIGASAPLKCFDNPAQEAFLLGQAPPGFPVNENEQKKQADVYQQFDRACASHGGLIQYHMGTANVARDLDRLRAVVGDKKLNYYGPSYGSYLGATYANLFPSKVGRMVLDGNVPPREWNDAHAGASVNTFGRLQSPLGSEAGLITFLTACGTVATSRCAFSAGSPWATWVKYQTMLTRLKFKPATVNGQSYTYPLTTTAVLSMLEFVQPNELTPGWKGLAELLQAIDTQGPGPTLPTDAAGGLPEWTAGVLCSESPNPRDPLSYLGQGQRLDRTQSPSGFGSAWSFAAQPCAQWQARDADAYHGPFDRATPPILAVGTLGDSNTAYTGTVKLAFEMSNVRVLTETGGGHTALVNKSACADAAITRYLTTGALPPRGTVCKQDRKPF